MHNGQRLWSKDFILALGVASFLSFVFYLLITTMAEYAAVRFGASDMLAGFAASAFVVGALAARIVTGVFLDVVGRYRVLIVGVGASVAATLLYLPVDGLWTLIAVRILHGITFGTGHTAIMASVQSIIPEARRAEGTGYFSTSTTLAAALGPFLALFLIRDHGYEWLFIASASFSLIGFIGLLFLRIPESASGVGRRVSRRSFRPSNLLDPAGLRIGSIMFLAGIAYSSIMAFLTGYTASLGMADAAPYFFLSFAVFSLAARLTLGRVQDRFGDNVVIYPLFSAFFTAMMLVMFAQSPWMIAAAGVFAGVGFGSLMSSTQAITISAAGPARVGVATSTYFLMMDLGFGLGPVVLGKIVGRFSYEAMYAFAASVVVIAGLLYFLVHGRSAGRRR
ncbi:MFS transporter [Brevibacterium daeguense]|uniref:MFS transporter n=1 Tax=Brevibacterium daeguense TaxID=909936 RepID=A0ABP8EMU0_9MICO